jgi:hypothetical protein
MAGLLLALCLRRYLVHASVGAEPAWVLRSSSVALVRDPVALIGGGLALVGVQVALVRDAVALIGDHSFFVRGSTPLACSFSLLGALGSKLQRLCG